VKVVARRPTRPTRRRQTAAAPPAPAPVQATARTEGTRILRIAEVMERVYERPRGDDDPLDAIETLLVATLVPIITERVRAELAAEEQAAPKPALRAAR
jgi:hypothetical protein